MLNNIRQLYNFIYRGWLYILGMLLGFGGFIYKLNSDLVWYFKILLLAVGIFNLYLSRVAWEARDKDVADD